MQRTSSNVSRLAGAAHPSGRPDLTALLSARHARTEDGRALAPQAPAPAAPDRRSQYMVTEPAKALAAALEKLSHATRQPKHDIMAAPSDI